MTEPAITSRADVTTSAPDRCAKQLRSHLSRKIEFTTNGAVSSATVGGATAQIVVGDRVLTLLASGDDEQAVAFAEDVLGSHLERFGQRNELTVSWTRGPDVQGDRHLHGPPPPELEPDPERRPPGYNPPGLRS